MKATLAEYHGRPCVALAIWDRDQGGRWLPLPGRGLSVRLGEIDGLIAALQQARAIMGDRRPSPRVPSLGPRPAASGADGGERPRYVGRRARREPVDLVRLRPIEPTADRFDEF